MSFKDQFSNFGWYNAIPTGPDDGTAGATNGNTIDLRGFNAATLTGTLTSICSGGANGAGDYLILVIQHGLASAAGVSAWSNVPGSMLVHSVVGGYDSTGETGVFLSIASGTEFTGSTQASYVFTVGYKGDAAHRYIRFKLSNVGGASAVDMGALWMLGQPGDWPINTPVNIS
jgi:hypothetical protein